MGARTAVYVAAAAALVGDGIDRRRGPGARTDPGHRRLRRLPLGPAEKSYALEARRDRTSRGRSDPRRCPAARADLRDLFILRKRGGPPRRTRDQSTGAGASTRSGGRRHLRGLPCATLRRRATRRRGAVARVREMKRREAQALVESARGDADPTASARIETLYASLVATDLRSLRLGLGHQSPDDQWWLGQAALDGSLLRIKGALSEARRDARPVRRRGPLIARCRLRSKTTIAGTGRRAARGSAASSAGSSPGWPRGARANPRSTWAAEPAISPSRSARAGGTVVGVDRGLEALDHARRHRGAGAMLSPPTPARCRSPIVRSDSSSRSPRSASSTTSGRRSPNSSRVARRRVVLGLLNRASVLHRTHGAGGGRGGYRGARWHTVGEARALFDDLPAGSIDVRTAVADPDGGAWARLLDRRRSARDGGRGAFIAVSASLSLIRAAAVADPPATPRSMPDFANSVAGFPRNGGWLRPHRGRRTMTVSIRAPRGAGNRTLKTRARFLHPPGVHARDHPPPHVPPGPLLFDREPRLLRAGDGDAMAVAPADRDRRADRHRHQAQPRARRACRQHVVACVRRVRRNRREPGGPGAARRCAQRRTGPGGANAAARDDGGQDQALRSVRPDDLLDRSAADRPEPEGEPRVPHRAPGTGSRCSTTATSSTASTDRSSDAT